MKDLNSQIDSMFREKIYHVLGENASRIQKLNIRYTKSNKKYSKEMGERLAEGISQAVSDSSVIAEMRGRGLMLAIETVVPDSIEPNAQAAGQLMEATRASGLLIGKGGLYGNVIRIAPPMTVTADEIDEGIAILNEAIKDLDN